MLRFVRILLITTGLLGVNSTAFAQTPEPTHWIPTAGMTWQILLSDSNVGEILPVEVYDLDGFETTKQTVERLHERGIKVICYIDAGTREDWRPDADQYPDEIIGNSWDEWEGERYVDIRRIDLLAPILEARLDMCAEKGFDAVDPDNMDTVWADTGFSLTEQDQIAFNRWIATTAHERGLAVGQKNVAELTNHLVDVFDFAVSEDCLVDGWCDQLNPYIAAGKPVFAIEYTDQDVDFEAMCAVFAKSGFSGVLKHRDLDAWARVC
ncbi:MAG: endo alpha-1,4 polygalactosaminidase [Thermomicrobiales bacterium]